MPSDTAKNSSADTVEHFDIIVVGMGPAGATISAYLSKAGLRVLAIEKQSFPRYHIGESLTGTAGDVIRELGLVKEVEGIGAQLKSGVCVVGANARSRFFVPTLRPTWQVRRSSFDELLANRSVEYGTERRRGTVEAFIQEGERVCGVVYKPAESQHGHKREVRARYVIDCSGQSILLSRHKIAGPRKIDVFGRQIAVFGQFPGAIRDPGEIFDATVIFYSEPFHWAWFIPIDPETVSVGVVIPRDTFREAGMRPDEVMRWGVENINPDLTRRVRGCPEPEQVRVIRNYSYSVAPFVGPGWFCVGDAHRFTDPIFSFGVAFAMTEARKAAGHIIDILHNGVDETEAQAAFVEFSDRGQDAASDLIRYFWSYPGFFAYQTRGSLREDFMRLLAGDCFGDDPMQALVAMRESLKRVPVPAPFEGDVETITALVKKRQPELTGLNAAYIEHSELGTRLSFLLNHDDPDRCGALCQLEEELYAEFGRDRLAVLSYPPEIARAVRFARDTIPGQAPLVEIFARRSA